MPDTPANDTAEDLAVMCARLAKAGWPTLLIRAALEAGEYRAHVTGVGELRFTRARPDGDGWVELTLADPDPGEWRALRGKVEVRVEDVRLVARE